MTLEDLIELSQEISATPENLVGTPEGRKVFEQEVVLDNQKIPVRVVLNCMGGLRTVFIKRN